MLEDRQLLSINPLSQPVEAPPPDGLDQQDRSHYGQRPYGAEWYNTAEYMIGDVKVNLVLVESDTDVDPPSGDTDPDLDTWGTYQPPTGPAINDVQFVSAAVNGAFAFWQTAASRWGLKPSLTFVPDLTYFGTTATPTPFVTDFEPIEHSTGQNSEDTWISQFLTEVHQTRIVGSPPRDTVVDNLRQYADTQRQRIVLDNPATTVNEALPSTQWSFTIFFVNAKNDADGQFVDGVDRRAQTGEPYMISTYHPQTGQTSEQLAAQLAHDIGRMFFALDEDSPAEPYTAHSGYYNTQNTNSQWARPLLAPPLEPSIMNSGQAMVDAYRAYQVSTAAKAMIGWQDTGNLPGVPDVLDVPLTLDGYGYYNYAAKQYEFYGVSSVQTLHNINPNTEYRDHIDWLSGEQLQNAASDITINSVDRLWVSLEGEDWINDNETGPADYVDWQTLNYFPKYSAAGTVLDEANHLGTDYDYVVQPQFTIPMRTPGPHKVLVYTTAKGTDVRSQQPGDPPTEYWTQTFSLNHAPQIQPIEAMSLAEIAEDDVNNPGTLVKDIFASGMGNPIIDADDPNGDQQGIAVIASNNSYGTWQYSLNDGLTWLNLATATDGTVADSRARLLRADDRTRIRLVPAADVNTMNLPLGILNNAITFRGWDMTHGANGGTIDATPLDGSGNLLNVGDPTPLSGPTLPPLGWTGTPALNPSVGTMTASIRIWEVNDAPIRTAGVVANLTVPETTTVTTPMAQHSLGLTDLDYLPGPANEPLAVPGDPSPPVGAQHQQILVVQTPDPALGWIRLSDGTIVMANATYSLAQVRGMVFEPKLHVQGGPSPFVFEVIDDGSTHGYSDPARTRETIWIRILAENDLPQRVSAALLPLEIPEDSPLVSLGLTNIRYVPGQGSDEASQNLTIEIVQVPNPALGKVYLGDGTTPVSAGRYSMSEVQGMTFRPAPDAFGSAQFIYDVIDDGITADQGDSKSIRETLPIRVWEVNDPPVTYDDFQGTRQNTPLVLDLTLPWRPTYLISNDLPGPANEAGQTLRVVSVEATPDTHGIVTLVNNVVTYVPEVDYHGTASFRYWVADDGTTNGLPDSKQSAGLVHLVIHEVNNAPVRTAGVVANLTVDEDSGRTSLGFGGLTYATGDAGRPPESLKYEITTVPPAYLGQLIRADGTPIYVSGTAVTLEELRGLQFQPYPEASGGPVLVQFKVIDDDGTGLPGGRRELYETFTIAVSPRNDPPVAYDQQVSVAQGVAKRLTLTGSSGDVGVTQQLTFQILMAPQHGRLTGLDPLVGNVTYTPDAGYTGSDLFTFQVTDDAQAGPVAGLTSRIATVTLQIGRTIGAAMPGLWAPQSSTFFLKNTPAGGDADTMYNFGVAGLGWIPLVGDWNHDGMATPGMYDPASSTFFLKNTHEAGPADVVFSFGAPARDRGVGAVDWIPLAGDWDGDGTVTVGLYDPTSSTFFLTNRHAGGAADVTFSFGVGGLGWQPVVGDWDGVGGDGVGLYVPDTSTFFLKNAFSGGPAEMMFNFGVGGLGWQPLAGDWDGAGGATVGMYVPSSSTFFLRNGHSGGPADLTFDYGVGGLGWRPVMGCWQSSYAKASSPAAAAADADPSALVATGEFEEGAPFFTSAIVGAPQGPAASPAVAGMKPFGTGNLIGDDLNDYMLGDISVSVVLFESDRPNPVLPAIGGGARDYRYNLGNLENWTSSEMANLKQEITDSLDGWAQTYQNQVVAPRQPLNFKVDWTHFDYNPDNIYDPTRGPVRYNRTEVGGTIVEGVLIDPINQTWLVDQFLNRVGYNSAAPTNDDMARYNDSRRLATQSHWAFTIFVVDAMDSIQRQPQTIVGNAAVDSGQFRFVVTTADGSQTSVAGTNLVSVGANNVLRRFNSGNPDVILGTVTAAGLVAGDQIVALDMRPSDGRIYALANGLEADRIYTVDPYSGASTLVSTLSTTLVGTSFGMDFNPVLDRLRIVSDADQNLRVNVASGVAVAETAENPGNPTIVAAAYDNNNEGALSTLLYTIDTGTDTLNVQDPPSTGTQTRVGSLGVDAADIAGFEIAPETNEAFASLTVGGVTGLYRINLSTGAATYINRIGPGNLPMGGLTALSNTVTTWLPYDATPAQVQAALAALPNVGYSSDCNFRVDGYNPNPIWQPNVEVVYQSTPALPAPLPGDPPNVFSLDDATRSGQPVIYRVNWRGPLAGLASPRLAIESRLLDKDGQAVTYGVTRYLQSFTPVINGNQRAAATDDFILNITTETGIDHTAPLPADATAAEVQAALEALTSIGLDNVLVTSSQPGTLLTDGARYTITWRGTKSWLRETGGPTVGMTWLSADTRNPSNETHHLYRLPIWGAFRPDTDTDGFRNAFKDNFNGVQFDATNYNVRGYTSYAFPGGRYAQNNLAGGDYLVTTMHKEEFGLGGISDMIAHQVGHIFYALDEYAGTYTFKDFPQGTYIDVSGYLGAQNSNATDLHPMPNTRVPTVMANPKEIQEAFRDHLIAAGTAAELGWRDTDLDGNADVLDVPLQLTASGHYNAFLEQYEFDGYTVPLVVDNLNPLVAPNSRNATSITTANRLQYQTVIDGVTSDWTTVRTYNMTGGTANGYLIDVDYDLPLSAPGKLVTVRFRTVSDETGTDDMRASPVWFDTFVVNSAPVLHHRTPVTGAGDRPRLTPIEEDEAPSVGTPISTLLTSVAGLDMITDPDLAAVEGIAITAVDKTNGTWQYTVDHGIHWNDMGDVSPGSARLLANDSMTRVRFLPFADFAGTVDAAITFRAWDQTAGRNGGLFNAAAFGGATPFSSDIETASILVQEVNDAPVARDDSDVALGLVSEEDRPLVIPTAALLANDAPGPANESNQLLEVVAVTPTPSTHGLLFLQGGMILYLPEANYNGPASFTYTVVDNGTKGRLPNPLSATASVYLTLAAINDMPEVTSVARPQDLAVSPSAHLVPLGLGGVTYGPGGGVDEAGQLLRYSVLAVPDPGVGQILWGNGVTPVAAGDSLALADLQRLLFEPGLHAGGKSGTFTFSVSDNGTSHGLPDPKVLTQSITISVVAMAPPPESPTSTAAAVDSLDLAALATSALGDSGLSDELVYDHFRGKR